MKPQFNAAVYLGPDEENARRPLLVFARGRIKYHAIVPRDKDIALVTLESLRHFTPMTFNGSEYPPKRAEARAGGQGGAARGTSASR